jgi:hypothetical protein
MRQLTGWDLICLKIIGEQPGIPYRELLMVCNLYVLEQRIGGDYATVHISKKSVEVAVEKLRFAGLLQPSGTLAVHAANAARFWKRIGHRWQAWPWYIPVDREGQILFDEAKERP